MADWSLAGDGQDYQAIGRDGGGPWGVAAITDSSANSKGDWAALDAVAASSSWLVVHLHGFSAVTGTPGSTVLALADVAVGDPGYERVVVSNLLFATSAALAGRPAAGTCVLPLTVAAGEPLSVRVQTSDGYPATFGVSATTVACGWGASSGGADCQTWGDVPSASTGTSVTPGTAPDYGSYVAFVDPSESGADWLVIAATIPGSYPAAGTRHAYLVDVAVGASGHEVVVVPAWPLVFDELGQNATPFGPPLPVSIPAGSRVSVRTTTSTGGPNLSFALYAIGG